MLAATSTALTTDVWYTMRATGIVALVLLSLTTVLGILTAGRVRTRSWPAFAQAELHKRISLLAVVFVGLHVLTAVVDSYVDVGWISILVPFASPYRPLWTGLGTVAVDLVIAVAVSSALRQRIEPRIWRGIHWLAYASWPVAVAHSLGMGTDASRLWMDALTGLCVAAVVAALAWRLRDRQVARTEAQRVGATTRAVPLRHRPEALSGAIRVRPGGPQTPVRGATATRLLERDSR
jgi:predicted ferric reductase